MKALVMFKRVNAQGVTQILAEIRPYGCYNGFNVQGAFGRMPQHTDFIANVTAAGDIAFASVRSGEPVRQTTDVANTTSGTDWECLGIGWLSERAAQSYDQVMASGQSIGRNHETVMLNRETVFHQYYDARNDRWNNTNRERTPNEMFVAAALNLAYRSAWNSAAVNQGIKDSQVLRALWTTHYYGAYMDMDFVGSERSSGMAVAYLQVYRNSARLFQAPVHNTDVRDTLLEISRVQGIKSLIPFLSALTHGGGDSDIFSHTNGLSGLVAAQACIHGIFSLQPFMERRDSMLAEGRYAKGNQSNALSQNLNRAYRETGRAQINVTGWEDLVGSLTGITKARRNLSSYLNMGVLSMRGRQQFLSELNTRLDAFYNSASPATAASTLTNLKTAMLLPPDQRIHGNSWDLRTPVRPIPVPRNTTRVAGAAQGFSQWVAATDARFGDTVTRQQTAADVARSNAAGVPV